MHRGVRAFIEWIDGHREHPLVHVHPPASSDEIAALERELGGPMPTDLRLVVTRFNGGEIPSGTFMPVGIEPGTIGACIREYASREGKDFLDPDLLLPFHRTHEGSLLAFDRSAGPVSDTWSIVDYEEETGEHRLVYRTFDGWCRACVAEWTSDDFGAEFTLDTYLRKGERHTSLEPDVATAHATVAHAQKRAGRPEHALAEYLKAARCTPPQAWCDWEALKLAAILGKDAEAFEAASRLCSLAPIEAWERRETTPGRVAEVLGPLAMRAKDPVPWLRLLSLLALQCGDDPEEKEVVDLVHVALENDAPLPPVRPLREQTLVPDPGDDETWWRNAHAAYHAGQLRDEDLLFDPALRPLARRHPFAALLRIRRDF